MVEHFLGPDELAAARAALPRHYPTHEDYFADPSAHLEYADSQFAGLRVFPFRSWALNRLAFHPDLVDAATRYFDGADLEIYKVELWAKYAGAVDYDQPHHRDFANHSLVVPRADGFDRQLTTFILLSDVTELDAPTALVPLDAGRCAPMLPRTASDFSETAVEPGAFADVEEMATGPAGSLLHLPDRRAPPRHDIRRATPFTLRDVGRLPTTGLILGREGLVARPRQSRALRRDDGAGHASRTRAVRVSAGRLAVLERPDPGRCPGPIPRHGHDAVRNARQRLMLVGALGGTTHHAPARPASV